MHNVKFYSKTCEKKEIHTEGRKTHTFIYCRCKTEHLQQGTLLLCTSVTRVGKWKYRIVPLKLCN